MPKITAPNQIEWSLRVFDRDDVDVLWVEDPDDSISFSLGTSPQWNPGWYCPIECGCVLLGFDLNKDFNPKDASHVDLFVW